MGAPPQGAPLGASCRSIPCGDRALWQVSSGVTRWRPPLLELFMGSKMEAPTLKASKIPFVLVILHHIPLVYQISSLPRWYLPPVPGEPPWARFALGFDPPWSQSPTSGDWKWGFNWGVHPKNCQKSSHYFDLFLGPHFLWIILPIFNFNFWPHIHIHHINRHACFRSRHAVRGTGACRHTAFVTRARASRGVGPMLTFTQAKQILYTSSNWNLPSGLYIRRYTV